ncbi:hypothetical protein RFI_03163 [Reticulomyxa filosa]|uniref:Uncharacterized protein n=1 Tax=Reticulomyxa filosa TaxID=46433 RepID=X6P799_RETFI|nr:hypothetical protein RFI_03163 [Reticulomyxa filosa]|eukprot:ETO33934.1 hypothetical protein RFI_03163 [Reticulomyxa filosa]
MRMGVPPSVDVGTLSRYNTYNSNNFACLYLIQFACAIASFLCVCVCMCVYICILFFYCYFDKRRLDKIQEMIANTNVHLPLASTMDCKSNDDELCSQRSGGEISKSHDSQFDEEDNSDNINGNNDDDNDGIAEADREAKEMVSEMVNLVLGMTEKDESKEGDRSNDRMQNEIWSQLLSYKHTLEPSFHSSVESRLSRTVQGFPALRDLLSAFPSELACSIFKEQLQCPHDHIRDITLQRGCQPVLRFSANHFVTISQHIDLDQFIQCFQKYMQIYDERQLLSIFEDNGVAGYRLHQVTGVIRGSNEPESVRTLTALNFRVGRLWTPKLEVIHNAIDFWANLEKSASILVLGPNTAEKAAIMRELTRVASQHFRTALVDTRSTIGGFDDYPVGCGLAMRFLVRKGSVDHQHQIIDQTRSISPQVVVVGETINEDDIGVLSKLQREGIRVIVGTNVHSLSTLLRDETFNPLLPVAVPMEGGLSTLHFSHTLLSPHLLVLELNATASKVRMYKDIPDAVRQVRQNIQPKCDTFVLKWDETDSMLNPSQIHHAMSRRYSKPLATLIQQTLSASKHTPSRVVCPEKEFVFTPQQNSS